MLILPLALQAAVVPAVPPLKCPLTAPYDRTNPFARIIRGELTRAPLVAETADMVAFVPLDWDYPGHALVVPKRAVRSLDDMTPAELMHALQLVRRVAAAQRQAFGATGYTLSQNNGRNQDVCHAHFHVVPNTPKETVKGATPEQMTAITLRLKAALPPE